MFAGVPCSGHVWISRSSTGESKTIPLGDPSKETTRISNMIAARWGLAASIATIRQVMFACEQPGSSVLYLISFIRPS